MFCFEQCSARYTVIKMRNAMRRTSAIITVTMENSFPIKCREAIMQCYSESTPCTVSEDKWDTDKSMKHALYVLRYANRCQAEVMLNSEKIKPVSLSSYACLKASVSQSVSHQSASQSVISQSAGQYFFVRRCKPP